MIYFVSDTHFSHANILKYCNRPFSSIRDHDKTLIKNWNSAVKPEDTVYHLGDFGFAHHDVIANILQELNGKKIFIWGNHDKSMNKQLIQKYFQFDKDIYEVKVDDEEMNVKQSIILCHYPFESWNKKYHGSWHLHGHCHGTVSSSDNMARLDVGVDCHNFKPISYDEVKFIMTEKFFKIF